jgi:hypothetical protein
MQNNFNAVKETPMLDSYSEILPEYMEDLSRLGSSGARLTFFLHLPKTGGSSVLNAVRNHGSMGALFLPIFTIPKDEVCLCGDSSCNQQIERTKLLHQISHEDNTGKEVMIFFGHHTTYTSALRIIDAIEPKSPISFLTTVRPARQRVVSAFRDYWTQVENMKVRLEMEEKSAKQSGKDVTSLLHGRGIRSRYVDDSKHYVDDDGNINGIAWVSAFHEHGPGVPFYLDEVFEGNPRLLRKLIRQGVLRAVPTRKVDELTQELTGKIRPRNRTSLPPTPQVDKAIEDARDVIDLISRRDAAYDKVLAKYLDSPDFAPVKPRWRRKFS